MSGFSRRIKLKILSINFPPCSILRVKNLICMKYYYTIPLMEGIFAVNKPVGITSHDVIYKLRRQTGIKRIGHAGTLDPLASGVLVVAIGREYTKQLDSIVKSEKEYIAEIFLGQT